FLDVQVSALSRERVIRSLYGDPGRPVDEPGRLAMADHGTLYLENADMLPPAVQASLTAGLRDGVFPVPGSKRVVRSEPLLVVSLTDAPERLIDAGHLAATFVGAFPHVVEIPPLRRRREDLPDLLERFVDDICREYGRDRLAITPEAFAVLAAHEWKGNVRELQRAIERMVLLAAGPTVGPEDLPAYLSGRSPSHDGGLDTTLRSFEPNWLLTALREVDGDLARAAARLGLGIDDFKVRLRRFGSIPMVLSATEKSRAGSLDPARMRHQRRPRFTCWGGAERGSRRAARRACTRRP
ncbi:MAG: sigma 54-interacting transcriptional regulator, partial [Acidobacteria bacterium]|nr:sigma 54-interacting transcriptional regulator [Acidobacteriota bacterium]